MDTIQQPMLFDDDRPRVHKSDPVTSHMAADKSQKTVKSVRARVLDILNECGSLAAFEVCEVYARRAQVGGWPHVTHEAPRKRMSDLKKDGLLVETGQTRINREGSPEVVLAVKL
jgi:hypothetical protein